MTVARANTQTEGIGLFRVLTLAQAAAVIGVEERSITQRARRRAEKGRPVAWTRNMPGNPMGCALVDANWVATYADEHEGPQAEIEPSFVRLPIRPNGPRPVEGDPRTGSPRTESEARLSEMERLLDSTVHAHTTAEQVRMEQENARLRAEVAHWRRTAAQTATSLAQVGTTLAQTASFDEAPPAAG